MKDEQATGNRLPATGNGMRNGVGGLWVRHLSSLVFPLLTLSYVATGPHPPWQALPGLAIVVAVVLIDGRARAALHPPLVNASGWPFTALVCTLAVIQLLTIVLMVRMVRIGGFSIDLLLVGWFIGNNSGWGTLVVAHELIHRRERLLQWLGRALLWTVLYDHFAVEHVRGHHVRVGTPDDPATARFGETYYAFLRRTVPGQFRSAWRLEARRLGDEDMRAWDPRLLRSRVVHGLMVELALLVAIGFAGGPVALLLFLWQAYNAITLLEAVNYFEHWGLQRMGERSGPTDAWDTDSWFTLYTLVGLSRHADHHAHAARPFQELRYVDESPKLPRGYYGMVVLAQLRNRTFQRLMTAELERRRLGPFAALRATNG
jgi:alkane 1-monooxygenase